MKDLKESVSFSLDGHERELFPYFPFILQDLWEIGSDPKAIAALIRENLLKKQLRILDLGCGKGAVSVKLAMEFKCYVKGIDAIPEFVEAAKNYAKCNNVDDKCIFEQGDIRLKIDENRDYDVIILGAIGPIFGNIYETLSILRKCLTVNGFIILDDGYIQDESDFIDSRCLRKSEFYKQINAAGFSIVDEIVFSKERIENSDNDIYKMIEKRIDELILKEPDKKNIFMNYLDSQKRENFILENNLVTGTWLLKYYSDKQEL